jgi:hypothetical protein
MLGAAGALWLPWLPPAAAAPVAALDEDTDTPYVPTPIEVVERMLQLAEVGPKDFLIDLGSGDGRIVTTAAARFGARGLGIEIDPRLVRRSNEYARRLGVAERVQFRAEDLFTTDLSPASVITMYLLPKVVQMLTPRLAALRPGVRIVSHDYALSPEWRPDFTIRMAVPDKPVGHDKHSLLMLWTVPAQVAGTWRWTLPPERGGQPVVLALAQRQQMLKAQCTIGEVKVDVIGPRIEGERLRFLLEPVAGGARLSHEFDGTVAGDTVTGQVIYDGEPLTRPAPWKARRGAA